ncbi:IS110 family transposase [Aliifodinibius sp. S!AR15-10]|nr:IS110 family transposase [Aliifodinibius sp. S!AR15-10]
MVNSALNDNGELLRREHLPANKRALLEFFGSFPEPVQAVVESTSSWYWLADWCQANEIPLSLAHAKMTKAISYAKVKTDKVDAKTLAELLRVGLIPQAHKVMVAQRDLRELTRGGLRMVQRRERLQKYNVHIDEVGWYYPDQLQSMLAARLPQVAAMEAKLLLEQILQLHRHTQQMEQEIEAQGAFTRDLELILPIPGIGMVGGWTILAEVGDICRFPSDRQFCSYCRLVPGSKDSGGSHRHKSGNKDGNKYLRLVFGQAAISAYSQYRTVKKFYNKIKCRSGKNVARTVVGKELAKGVWHVLTKQEPYKGFKGQPTRVATRPHWPQPISPSFREEELTPYR